MLVGILLLSLGVGGGPLHQSLKTLQLIGILFIVLFCWGGGGGGAENGILHNMASHGHTFEKWRLFNLGRRGV